MKKRLRLLFVIAVLVLTSAACKLFIPDKNVAPTSAPEIMPALATPTRVPALAEDTATPAPSPEVEAQASPTARPTRKPAGQAQSSPTPDLGDYGLPSDAPLETWHDLPIMPGAIAGRVDEDLNMYTFTTKASAKEVQDYYKKALAELGFSPLGAGESEGSDVILIFSNKDNDMLMLTTLDGITAADELMVMLSDMR